MNMKTPDKVQQLADQFAVPNDTMREFIMWHEGEMHQYGKELQGKIIDQGFTINDKNDEIDRLKDVIERQQEQMNDVTIQHEDMEKLRIQYNAELEAVKTRTRWNEEEAKEWKARWESAVIDGDLLRTKNEELQERVEEAESDYQDLCELTKEVWLMTEPGFFANIFELDDYNRFKNHIQIGIA